MMTLKAGRELIDVTKLAHLSGLAIMYIGSTGVGKSEIAAQAASEMGIEYIVRDLSLMEAPDLSGLPEIKDGRMHYAIPAFLPTNPDSRGMICFEELNRAHRSVQNPCLQLLTTGNLNSYRFPGGWTAIACINPQEEGYDVELLDPALMARFLVVRVVPDVKCWLQWADENDVHAAIRSFIRTTPKIFEAEHSNPRAWVYCSKILKAAEAGTFMQTSLPAALAGFVGDTLAKAFLKEYSSGVIGKVPSAEEILHNYHRRRARVLKWMKDGNSASIDCGCKKLLLYLQDPSNERLVRNDSQMNKNLRDFHADIPEVFRKMLELHVRWLKEKAHGRK